MMIETLRARVKTTCANINHVFLSINLSISYDGGEGLPKVLDEEGEEIFSISYSAIEAIGMTVTEDAKEIILSMLKIHIDATTKAVRRGFENGRADVFKTVHELLGIDKIAKALTDPFAR